MVLVGVEVSGTQDNLVVGASFKEALGGSNGRAIRGHLKSLPAMSNDDHGGTRSSSIHYEHSRMVELTPAEERSGAPEVVIRYL